MKYREFYNRYYWPLRFELEITYPGKSPTWLHKNTLAILWRGYGMYTHTMYTIEAMEQMMYDMVDVFHEMDERGL